MINEDLQSETQKSVVSVCNHFRIYSDVIFKNFASTNSITVVVYLVFKLSELPMYHLCIPLVY